VSSRLRVSPTALAVGGALLLAGAVRFWRLGEPALIGDEGYYWLWSQHLDWAYWDHPAGTAVLTWLSTALGGQSEAGVRWLNALLGVGSVLGTYAVGIRMLSQRAGLLAALLVALGAPYVVTSRHVYTDALQLAALLLSLLFFWRLVERPEPSWASALGFGLSLVLVLNTKYNAYLYAAALLGMVLLDHRHLLRNRRAWCAAGLGVVGLLPVLLWNAEHGWVSFRWQLEHMSFALSDGDGLWGSLRHSTGYLTWPLVLLALLGVGRMRTPAERLLSTIALFLLLPVGLSAANSPRNLSTGLVPLLLLAGLWLRVPRQRTVRWVGGAVLAVGVAATGVYGLGTAAGLLGYSAWPQSSVTSAIREDALGVRELGARLATAPGEIFCLDYSLAGQVAYYSGRPAATSWGQYQLWGIPSLEEATIVGLEHLAPAGVTARLREAYVEVDGPRQLTFREAGVAKTVYLWEAHRLVWDQGRLVEELDFLRLLKFSRSK
jgi:4-amino-4-deoxy-L-arabinose transferase-like glycosyltransferase